MNMKRIAVALSIVLGLCASKQAIALGHVVTPTATCSQIEILDPCGPSGKFGLDDVFIRCGTTIMTAVSINGQLAVPPGPQSDAPVHLTIVPNGNYPIDRDGSVGCFINILNGVMTD